jgi:DNA modification methylase
MEVAKQDRLMEKALRALEGRKLPPFDRPSAIPSIAKNEDALKSLAIAVREIKTSHRLVHGDARELRGTNEKSVHLVLTSPPYWTLKKYEQANGQLGHISNYHEFLAALERVWRGCFSALVPGGRLIVVVGDVCLSRRATGRHSVVPLHAAIQEQCRMIGFDNLAPIIWHKIANANYEVDNGGGFLGKPYEPNAVIKNDIEFILMQRKPGAYRSPTLGMRLLSVISSSDHKEWFQQIWRIPGASTRQHPAPFPLTLAERLVRMFSFVGDTVLDPFLGTGTTSLAAARWGRNSIGFEIDSHYIALARTRLSDIAGDMFSPASVSVEEAVPAPECSPNKRPALQVSDETIAYRRSTLPPPSGAPRPAKRRSPA